MRESRLPPPPSHKENVQPKPKGSCNPSTADKFSVAGTPIYRQNIRSLDRKFYQKSQITSKSANIDLMKRSFRRWQLSVRQDKAARKLLNLVDPVAQCFTKWKAFVDRKKSKWGDKVRARFFRDYWTYRRYLQGWKEAFKLLRCSGELMGMSIAYSTYHLSKQFIIQNVLLR